MDNSIFYFLFKMYFDPRIFMKNDKLKNDANPTYNYHNLGRLAMISNNCLYCRLIRYQVSE